MTIELYADLPNKDTKKIERVLVAKYPSHEEFSYWKSYHRGCYLKTEQGWRMIK